MLRLRMEKAPHSTQTKTVPTMRIKGGLRMIIDGYTVQPEAERALVEWIDWNGTRSWQTQDAALILRQNGCKPQYASRAAARAMQQKKKAGLVRFDRGCWWRVVVHT
jgi:hypothetical protein